MIKLGGHSHGMVAKIVTKTLPGVLEVKEIGGWESRGGGVNG